MNDELHKKAVTAFVNKPFSEAIDAVITVALHEAAKVAKEFHYADNAASAILLLIDKEQK